MKTDHPIYLFLSAGPEAFRILTGGLRLEGGYRFCSLTIKTLERRLDGILEPDGHEGPVYAIEFMGQPAPGAWYNLLTKIGLYGEQYPEREVTGILIYLRERDRPACPGWIGARGSMPFGVSLEQVLPDWLARESDNPYVAALAPLVIADDATLQAQAPALWHTVEHAPLPQAQRDLLAQVLEFWFFERFRGLTAKEIWAMLNLVTPIQETRAYRSIFAEGEAEGKAEGKADTLKRQLTRRFGALPDWARRRIEAAPVAQLDLWLDGIFDTGSAEDLIGREGGE